MEILYRIYHCGKEELIRQKDLENFGCKPCIDALVSRPIYNGLEVFDRVDLDYDGPNVEETIIRLDEFLSQYDAMRYYVLSGRGFHCYIMAYPMYFKVLDKSSYRDFIRRIQIGTGIEFDLWASNNMKSRIRLPGSVNSKNGAMCTYATNIGEKTSTKIIYGTKRVKIKKKTVSNESKLTRVKIESLPTCVKIAIENMREATSSHLYRFIVLTFLYNYKNFTIEDAEIFLKKVLPKNKYRHAVYEEKQHKYAFKYSFPSCETIKMYGLCDPCSFRTIRKTLKFIGKLTMVQDTM